MVREPHLKSSLGETTKNQRADPSATQGLRILTKLYFFSFRKAWRRESPAATAPRALPFGPLLDCSRSTLALIYPAWPSVSQTVKRERSCTLFHREDIHLLC